MTPQNKIKRDISQFICNITITLEAKPHKEITKK